MPGRAVPGSKPLFFAGRGPGCALRTMLTIACVLVLGSVLGGSEVLADDSVPFDGLGLDPPGASVDRSAAGALAQNRYLQGELALRGQGQARDPDRACVLFAEAAEQGHINAMLRTGQCLAGGWGGRQDRAEAVRWYRRAAERGSANAQAALGLALWRGEGTLRDDAEAQQWLARAARAGNTGAMIAIGLMIRQGAGVPPNEIMGMAWIRRAALAGDSTAALLLARAYERGEAVATDSETAAQWLQRAAELRNPAAQLLLAQWYLEGRAVERMPMLGHAWAAVVQTSVQRLGDPASAQRTRQQALAVQRQAELLLSPAELAQARELARDWVPGRIALLTRASPLPIIGSSPPAERLGAASPGPAPAAPVPAAPAAPAGSPRESSGSGFFVSGEGHLITNDHVVRDCRELRMPTGESLTLIGRDARSDLALLRGPAPAAVADIRVAPPLAQGETVLTYGYPLRGVLSASGQLGAGMVTALSGLRENPLHIQIDVPIQTGNSGGPLMDERGQVAGVVVSKLNALRVARVTGDIPQNVNFAVSIAPLQALLDAFGVNYRKGNTSAAPLSRQQLAERARSFTTAIVCTR
jgi:TPR repeat protein